MTNDSTATINGGERRVAFMIAGIIGLSVLSIVGLLICYAINLPARNPIWPVVGTIPFIGLPIAVVLILVLLVLGARRRSREAREQQAAADAAARPVPPKRVQPSKKKK